MLVIARFLITFGIDRGVRAEVLKPLAGRRRSGSTPASGMSEIEYS